MKVLLCLLPFLGQIAAFVKNINMNNRQQQHHHRSGISSSSSSSSSSAAAASASTTSLSAAPLQPGDPVMLVGPGFLQLVLARHLAQAGFRPIIVAPQKKLDSFFTNLLKCGPGDDLDDINKQLRDDSTIGMPEVGDPYFGELKGVVFCAEEAVLPPEFVSRVLDFQDQGRSAFADGRPSRVICCLPVDGKIQKEKSNSWIPIFNTDKVQQDNWNAFAKAFQEHSCYSSSTTSTNDSVGSIVRFGSLLGGSYDGPAWLRDYGIDEGMYKMSLEQYRDMRERAFDRYKLGAQVLLGNTINPKPSNQETMEKTALEDYPNEIREAFTILGDYPEMDRSNRHTVAAGIVQALQVYPTTPTASSSCPKEMTILSKARSELPSPEEWKAMFANPSAADWPDPYLFDPSAFGLQREKEKA
ncbi:hypothetical protein IV203_019042 [Nitzschia inconspicua]|uniref:Uncharacterized protein n=1 Tax=Nitzschia inconspicua TaxID=303405 RepID=A0A9K3KJ12_9STRA|nr:hypothetical protein IV203_022635 [Nitzschia inconspicua]KAG7370472.1 hypothetical protein IV203_019042 [Nitzschia inconspicua]